MLDDAMSWMMEGGRCHAAHIVPAKFRAYYQGEGEGEGEGEGDTADRERTRLRHPVHLIL